MTAQMATVSQKKVLSLILMVPLVQGTGLPVTIAVALTAPACAGTATRPHAKARTKIAAQTRTPSLCMSVSFRR